MGVVLLDLGGLLDELADVGELLGSTEVAIAEATIARYGEVDDVALEVDHLGRVLSAVRTTELHDAMLLIDALAKEHVDLIIEITEVVLPKALILYLDDLDADLLKNLKVPSMGLGKVMALGGEARRHSLGFLFSSCFIAMNQFNIHGAFSSFRAINTDVTIASLPKREKGLEEGELKA